MKDMKARLANADQHAQLLEGRLHSETLQFDAATEKMRSTIHGLTEQIEKEKLARHATSGALEAARHRFNQGRADVNFLDILARADDADARDREADAARGAATALARPDSAASQQAPATAPTMASAVGLARLTPPRPRIVSSEPAKDSASNPPGRSFNR